MSSVSRRLTLAALLAVLCGCSSVPVEPWQREDLARPEMQWDAGLIGAGQLRAHTYESKEATALGPVLGGGGCGCN